MLEAVTEYWTTAGTTAPDLVAYTKAAITAATAGLIGRQLRRTELAVAGALSDDEVMGDDPSPIPSTGLPAFTEVWEPLDIEVLAEGEGVLVTAWYFQTGTRYRIHVSDSASEREAWNLFAVVPVDAILMESRGCLADEVLDGEPSVISSYWFNEEASVSAER